MTNTDIEILMQYVRPWDYDDDEYDDEELGFRTNYSLYMALILMYYSGIPLSHLTKTKQMNPTLEEQLQGINKAKWVSNGIKVKDFKEIENHILKYADENKGYVYFYEIRPEDEIFITNYIEKKGLKPEDNLISTGERGLRKLFAKICEALDIEAQLKDACKKTEKKKQKKTSDEEFETIMAIVVDWLDRYDSKYQFVMDVLEEYNLRPTIHIVGTLENMFEIALENSLDE